MGKDVFQDINFPCNPLKMNLTELNPGSKLAP